MRAICITCRRSLPNLAGSNTGIHKCECGTNVPYTSGIYQFIETDTFYEGKFVQTKSITPLKLFIRSIGINGSEERMWRKSLKYIKKEIKKNNLRILNIGAGGGHQFLNALGSVTAVDLSVKSLINAKRIYNDCYQADASRLPFPDNSFDIVFSAHLLGHIPKEKKQQVIDEMYRVIRTGGFSLHSVECEADNYLYHRAKKYPDLYNKYFKDMYGHHGLEFPSLVINRFRNVNFKAVYEVPDFCKGVIRPIQSYNTFFGSDEFMEKEMLFKILASVSKLLSALPPVKSLTNILLYPISVINRFWGLDGVDSIKLLYQKR